MQARNSARALRGALLATVLTIFPGAIAAAQAQTVVYDVPAGPLPQALTAFGIQSGLHLAYAPEAAEGRTSPGLQGAASPEEALARILARSGLNAAFLDSRSVLIEAAPAAVPAQRRQEVVFLLEPITLYGARTVATLDEARASVAVVSGEPEAAPHAQSLRGSFQRMANVNAGDWTEDGFVIRGVNSEGLIPGGAGAPLASFYVDGVQQTLEGTRRGTRGFFDVEQVEVYRGPQSTLSGRAALAGAIYLRTKDPEFARSGAAQLTFGEDGKRQIGLAYGDSIGDHAAFRLSGEWSEKDSDLSHPSYERFARYKDFASDDYHVFRGKLLVLPTESTRLLLSASHAYDNPDYNEIAGPNWSTGAPGYGARRGDVYGDILPDMYRYLGLTELPAFQESRETRVDNLGLEATHDLTDNLRLTSLTGFSRSATERDSINVGTPGEFLQTRGEFTQRNISQEVRLNYDSGPLSATAGVYAGRADNDAWRESMLLSFDQSRNSADIVNLALFGEATYEFLPGLRVVAGGRLDHIRQNQDAFYAVNGATTADSRTEFTDTVFLPKLGLEYDLAEGQTLAFVYQHGYRPGGSAIRSTDGQVYSYDPEYAKNYELSWRGRLLDGRLSLGANVFYQDWRDQQIEILADPLVPTSGHIANAGRSESYGGELEVSFAATDKLHLYASAGLLHTEFEDFNLSGWGADFSGLPFPNAPERSLAAGFRWGGEEGFFVAGSAKHVSSSMSRLEQGVARPVTLGARTLVDAEAGYAWENLKLTAYATNLFDKEYFTYEYGPGAMATLGDRREMGLRLDYRF
ncbi:TonB-dependent receptor [Neomegalonema sp.]|uniref:TonB-dependent receptor domain-containing protein n=1 Tax=Neomegalonema sp. TaxID=2039713 RepID=UPI00262EF69F|nr:TonB-dependent receptor [Neomegalonema sp.]MDD2867807.1 TonB-dependent receptor [Neomegalonema sp.]